MVNVTQQFFIDKLSVVQQHEKPLPTVSKAIMSTIDAQTGELLYDGPVKNRVFEGSYSSKINVFCDGHRVVVSGNPSRWNRSENLFGLLTIEDCINVYNPILLSLGLPALTPCTGWFYRQSDKDSSVKKFANGCEITQIDFTRNWSVGKGKEYSFLRGASSMKIGRRVGYLYPDGTSLTWGGGSYKYDKLYIKHNDLIRHQNKRTKSLAEDEKHYYQQVIDYCKNKGVVREEQSFKQKFLKRKNLNYYGLIREQDFELYLSDIETALKRLQVTHMTYETIAEQLLAEGVCKSSQSANSTEAIALKWMHGGYIDKTKSQYYEHRKRLLHIGIDIGVRHDVTRMAPQIRTSELIDLQLLKVPYWYRSPEKQQHLKLVC